MSDDLNKEGLFKVWNKVWTLVKKITGDVDINGKGDLQTQINDIQSKMSNNNVDVNALAPTFNDATTLDKIKSGDRMDTAFGKIAKAMTDLVNHLKDNDNPHKVTKETIGLGNVENVSVANMSTPLSTITKLKAIVKTYKSVTVPTSAFVAYTASLDYETQIINDYPYKADIELDGITAEHAARISFAPEDMADGVYAPFVNTLEGKIRIYSNAVPVSSLVLPTITAIRKEA